MCARESRARARESEHGGGGGAVSNLTLSSRIGLNLFHLNPHFNESLVVSALEFLMKLNSVHCVT